MLSGHARIVFLDAARAGNLVLREEAESLLAAEAASKGVLTDAVQGATASLGYADLAGHTLGPCLLGLWLLGEVIGQGGRGLPRYFGGEITPASRLRASSSTPVTVFQFREVPVVPRTLFRWRSLSFVLPWPLT